MNAQPRNGWRALALEHWRSDAFAVYQEALEDRGVRVDRVLVPDASELPDWREYDLILAMGGPMSVYEESAHPWLVGEKRTIREAVTAGVPYFGICFGAQLLASAFGGDVYRGPAPEVGLRPIFVTDAGRRDPLFARYAPTLDVLEWHQDTFELPAGAVHLAGSAQYANQAMRLGPLAYGIQCHFEKSAQDVRRSIEVMPALGPVLAERCESGSIDAFLDEYAAVAPDLQETGRELVRGWLELAAAVRGRARRRARTPRTAVRRQRPIRAQRRRAVRARPHSRDVRTADLTARAPSVRLSPGVPQSKELSLDGSTGLSGAGASR